MTRKKSTSKYPTPEELKAKVDEYFTLCQEQRQFADYAGMRLFLGLKKKDIEEMCSDGELADEYIDVFDYAEDRRECLLVRQLVTQPKLAQGIKLALAMPENGGYSEKNAEVSREKKFVVKLEGAKLE